MSELYQSATPSESSVSELFLRFSVGRIEAAVNNIHRCSDRLDDEQLWKRSGEWENSVANLILHLEGNIRQFILHAVAGASDVRQREREFSLDVRCSRDELMADFDHTLYACIDTIRALPLDELVVFTDPHTAGWSVMTKLECIYHAVGHLQLHTGQIIFQTKRLLAVDLDLSIPRVR